MNAVLEAKIALTVPEVLQEEAKLICAKLFDNLTEKQYQRLLSYLESSDVLTQQLIRSLVGSHYILDACCRDPELLFNCLLIDAPFSSLTPLKIIDSIDTACSDHLNPEEFDALLRRLRKRFMLILYWRDLNGLADFNEVSSAMTTMAEMFIQKALDFHYILLSNKYGHPIGNPSSAIQSMVVIGMGKLGASELNVSSDIDLIFAFPESGKTQSLKKEIKIRSIENQQFFNFLGRGLIKSLNENTQEGFVFRVDMRLRPYGDSGPLVSNYTALENYYQSQGREWERFAGIKARIVAVSKVGESLDAHIYTSKIKEDFYSIIKPFVFRKYVDFTMVDALRKLKLMIEQEVRRKGMQDDVKLGAGGIREIEFIVQSFQLIHGGRDSELQDRNLLLVLDTLYRNHYIEEEVYSGLRESYLFLRKLEHTIQAFEDKQTQELPTESTALNRLSWVVLDKKQSDFIASLKKHRAFVSQEFKKVVSDVEELKQAKNNTLQEWKAMWSTLSIDETFYKDKQNYIDSEQLILLLTNLDKSRNVNSLSASGRQKLDDFLPLLLESIFDPEHDQNKNKTEVITRLLTWLESIVTRSSYLSLLLENPDTLKHLVRLFTASSWVGETLAQLPSLLDELLSPDVLYSLPDKASLRDELRQRLMRIERDDIESNMEVLRYFRLAHQLQIAACEITGLLPLMKVSDYLTFTAEVILEQIVQLAWKELVARHGYPSDTSDENSGFLMVGYGKLGGIEMSYSSDLDLVFIYDNQNGGQTDGPRPIDNQTFYIRLGQKIIHYLNTRTLSGPLYEVDMRLRPSGNSGLLVTSMAAYSRYQKNDAWIWEHQALVRARPIAGDQRLSEQFIRTRREVLEQKRDLQELKAEVISMRNKMREHLASPSKSTLKDLKTPQFNLKQDAGGIVDIEFMVQYAVLAWSHQYPSLSEWTDNIRILESLQKLGFIDAAQSYNLIETYQSYRAATHRLALQQQSSHIVSGDRYIEEREQVSSLWQDWFN